MPLQHALLQRPGNLFDLTPCVSFRGSQSVMEIRPSGIAPRASGERFHRIDRRPASASIAPRAVGHFRRRSVFGVAPRLAGRPTIVARGVDRVAQASPSN